MTEQWKYTNISNIDFDSLVHNSGSIIIEESKNVEIIDLDKLPKKYYVDIPSINKIVSGKENSRNFSDSKIQKIEELQRNGSKGIAIIVKDEGEIKIKKTAVIGKIFVILEKDSTLKITEELTGNNLNATLDTFILKEGSKLYYSYIQNMDGGYDFSTKIFKLDNNSKIRATFGSFGSVLSRTNLISFIEKESDVEINCLYISNENQHIDINTISQHKNKAAKNKITTKGILLDGSTSIVRGLIKIDKAASNSSSFFEAHSLIEGDRCTSNSVPSLEIETNDVVCKHASTTGKIDESQLFYLTSRGMSEKEARKLLLSGYLEPLIKKTSLYDDYKKIIEEKLCLTLIE